MLRDVFYYGNKPNVHPREKFAASLEDARSQCTTEHFWIINEQCDYRNFDWDFDFDFLPDEDVWAEEHINVWPSQHQKDSGTWLVNTDNTTPLTIYRADVDIIKRKNIKTDNWVELDLVNHARFDFSWHPDPSDPPYIYKWGSKFAPVQFKPVLEYHTEGATQVKYIDQIVELLPNTECWVEFQLVNKDKFDMSWRPDPMDPPMIYVWGNKYVPAETAPTLEYHVPGGTEKKFMPEKLALVANMNNWELLEQVDKNNFDFAWIPDPSSPTYIYAWGNQWNKVEDKVSVQYIVEGATEYKYMEARSTRKPCMDNWILPDNVDVSNFDFSWEPSPADPAFIYKFGTQWQKTGGPRYVVEGATEVKFVSTLTAKALPTTNKWTLPTNIDVTDFDFSWHPDDTSPPYIYVFPTQWALSGGPVYTVDGATEIKYVEDMVAKAVPDKTNWEVPAFIDSESFDFSWHPYAQDEPYIYQFGTQWQKTGGPRYVVEGATETKYIDIQKAKALSNSANWTVPANIDVSSFDFSWHPDDTSPPYIYRFPTQWAMSGGPTYTVPNALEIKYVDVITAKALPNKTNWITPSDIDVDSFDFSWHPYVEDEPYIYQFGTQWQKTGGPKYITPGTHANSQVKYIDTRIIKATRLPNKSKFNNLDNNVAEFDYSWHPDSTEEPYIYVFGNTQYPAEIMPTIEYVVEGATQIKYINDVLAKLSANKSNWFVPDNVDTSEFDFSWVPNPKDPEYIYQFGTQWQKTGGPKYIVEGASEIKYIDTHKAKALPNKDNWKIPNDLVIDDFDYSWHPDTTDEAFIYEFGTQWHDRGGPLYIAKADPNGQIKYVKDTIAILGKNNLNWVIPNNVDVTDFDFSWIPHPDEPPYIYQFGTQWQKTGGPNYIVEGANEVKYVDSTKAKSLPNKNNWTNPSQADVSNFDYSWHPDETAPPYIYQFGTLLDKEDGPRYMSPNTNGEIIYLERVETLDDETPVVENFSKYIITTTLEDLIHQHPNELFWALNPDLDYSEFDFNWRPSIEQAQYVHAFGSSESEKTQTYLVNSSMWEKGFRELNWIEDKKLDDETLFKLFKKSDMFFVDRSNSESQSRFENLKQKYPNLQKTRYLNSWVDTINRCINRSTTELCWILNSELDYSDFNFEYYPNPWQMKMVQVFGTQWSHWGTTFMVNRETFAQDTKYIKIIEHLSNLNFVKDRKAKATNILYDIVYIDHGNMDMSQLQGNTVIKFQDSYIATFQKMLNVLPVKKEHYVWVASSVCDYKDFDFTYICDPFAKEQLHVFPSDRQKFGDTFLVDVNKLRSLIDDMNILEDYEKINYNQSQRVKRLPAPIIITEEDTHINSINTEFKFPYAVFTTKDNQDINVVDTEPMSLWTPESKNIQITSAGGTRIVVPKEAKEYVKRELYDYPYIITNSRLAKSSPMDIVFFSNGEASADSNYEHLLNITHGLPNKITRIDGVSGRVNSQHAAANSSNTSWYFLVNAKLKVTSKFDFNWQPDRLQIPKHYIFHATNPVNGLKYGHQAIVVNNKKLTLENFGNGLDFTMDSEHEIIKIDSGIAVFNTNEWDTWRTAFRECIKLKASGTDENKNRLEIWSTVGIGKFSQYSLDAAQHAVEYYDEVKGDFDKLKLSYDWAWLKTYYESKYNVSL